MFHKQLGSANEVALTFHHPMMALQNNHRMPTTKRLSKTESLDGRM